MVKSKHTLIALLLAAGLISSGCFKSKNVVERIPPAGGTKAVSLNGVPYALPRTVIVTTIPVKLTNKKPGALEKFAPCFFPRNVAAARVREKSRAFSVEQPTFATRGEPDPDARFIAKIKGGFFENKTMSLVFNNEGVISTGEAASTNEALPFLLKAARTAIGIGAKIATGGAAALKDTDNKADEETATPDQLNVELCSSAVIADAAANAVARAAAAVEEQNGETSCEDAPSEACRLIKEARAELEKAERLVDASYSEIAPINNDPINTKLLTAQGNTTRAIGHVIRAKELLVSLARLMTQTQCPAGKKCEQEQKVCEASKAAARQIEASLKFVGKDPCSQLPDELATINCKTSAATAAATPTPPATAASDCQVQNANQELAFANGYIEAKKTFEKIEELQGKLDALASGNALGELTADTLKAMIETTRATIKGHQNAFFGSVSEDLWTGKFDFTPATYTLPTSHNSMQRSPVLFMFSEAGGLCETAESRYQGVQIKDDFKAKKCPGQGMEAVWLSVRRSSVNDDYLGRMSEANARAEGQGERGFYYRIPAKAIVKVERGELTAAQIAQMENSGAARRERLAAEDGGYGQTPTTHSGMQQSDGQQTNGQQTDGQQADARRGDAQQTKEKPVPPPAGQEVGRETLTIAQLGVTASIPASAAGRTTQYTLGFDESTGALKNFRLGSNALLEKSMLEDVEGAANDIIDANNARDKARAAEKAAQAAGNDELAKKKRELELLKTQNEINEEKRKLEGSGDDEAEEEEEETPPRR